MSNNSIDLYDNVYADFASSAEAAVRRETYGEDLGQSSWLTASEWLGFADQLGVSAGSEVLEVGSGSGGPAVFLAAAATLPGDRRGHQRARRTQRHGPRPGARTGRTRSASRSWTPDAPLPSPRKASTPSSRTTRCATSATGRRRSATGTGVLRPGGRALFTDAMVLTGPVSHEELATAARSASICSCRPAPTRRCCVAAGFDVRAVQDVTANAAAVALRWHDARARHREALVAREGEANFDGLQRFLQLRAHAVGRAAAVAICVPGGEAGVTAAAATPATGRIASIELIRGAVHTLLRVPVFADLKARRAEAWLSYL